MQDDVNENDQARAQLLRATIGYLNGKRPHAVNLMPSTLGPDFSAEYQLFVEVIQGLIDDGMITVEFLVISGEAEPVALGALLTRKGAANRGAV